MHSMYTLVISVLIMHMYLDAMIKYMILYLTRRTVKISRGHRKSQPFSSQFLNFNVVTFLSCSDSTWNAVSYRTLQGRPTQEDKGEC